MRKLPSRRDTLRLMTGGLMVGAALPGLARAALSASDRRFLFVFVDGGWDPTWVFATVFDNSLVDMPEDAELAESGGLSWVSGANRPAVDDYFVKYGHRTAIVNGLEVRSVAHERCKRLLLTGQSAADADDFPSLIAASAATHLPLGHLVLEGPSYAGSAASNVVRVGSNGQLSSLLSGDCFNSSEEGLLTPNAAVRALEDAVVRRRVEAAAAAAGRGAEARISAAYGNTLNDLANLPDVATVLYVPTGSPMLQLTAAASVLGSGFSRCVMTSDRGFYGARWDHHSEISRQAPSYQLLFTNLTSLLDSLSTTPGTTGGTLLDEITVVVFSEMGRFPVLNASGGKDHWTTTSMMLIGGGIRGGTMIGGYDANMGGQPVIPETGETDTTGSAGGVLIEPAHIGATLLTLAGIDPAETFGDEVEPLTCLLDT
jgi:uncharacterized protein (DUF1501 family)